MEGLREAGRAVRDVALDLKELIEREPDSEWVGHWRLWHDALRTALARAAAAPQDEAPEPEGLREARSALISIAAALLRSAPSDIKEDYPQSRRVDHVLAAITASDEQLKAIALRIRNVERSLARPADSGWIDAGVWVASRDSGATDDEQMYYIDPSVPEPGRYRVWLKPKEDTE